MSRTETRRRREQVIEILSERFATDDLDVDEFEERVGRAHRASGLAELDALVADLGESAAADRGDALVPAERSDALVPAEPAANTALARSRPERRSLVSVLGTAKRRGRWSVPETLKVVTVLGGAELDLREVDLPPGVTEIKFTCVLSDVRVIVPPNLAVESDGLGILADITTVDRAPPAEEESVPVVRISGVSVLGDVDVETRLPGETRRDAKRRRKRLRRKAKARGELEA